MSFDLVHHCSDRVNAELQTGGFSAPHWPRAGLSSSDKSTAPYEKNIAAAALVSCLLLPPAPAHAGLADKTLDIYWIDSEEAARR